MVTIINQLNAALARPEISNLPLDVKKIIIKEYLQSYVLSYIYNHPQYRGLNFYGGTCAKVIYGLNRLSEDIDLDNTAQIDLTNLETDLIAYLHGTLLLMTAQVHTQEGRFGIQRWTIKIPILNELGLSPLADEKIHLKVEVSNHQQIATTIFTPVLHHGKSYVAKHFDLPSLMAGKMLACLERQFIKGKGDVVIKGRDFYDLIWYMQQQITPNEEKLLKDGKEAYTTVAAMEALKKKVAAIKPRHLLVDLEPLFIEQAFIKEWVKGFEGFFERFVEGY